MDQRDSIILPVHFIIRKSVYKIGFGMPFKFVLTILELRGYINVILK